MKSRIQSFRYALNGIRLVFGKEANMNIHLFISFLVVVCGFLFNIDVYEWIACILCMAVVISLEMMNSAIERIVDFVCPHREPKAGAIKDIAAGAVFVASICSAIIGLIVFVPKLVNLIRF